MTTPEMYDGDNGFEVAEPTVEESADTYRPTMFPKSTDPNHDMRTSYNGGTGGLRLTLPMAKLTGLVERHAPKGRLDEDYNARLFAVMDAIGCICAEQQERMVDYMLRASPPIGGGNRNTLQALMQSSGVNYREATPQVQSNYSAHSYRY